jgi:hypothetical protein
MAYDAALPLTTFDFAPPLARVQTKPSCMSAPYRAHEGVALMLGALSIGAVAGASIFFGAGRVDAWAPTTVALAAYVYAIYLIGLSWRAVLATRAPESIILFGLSVGALLAWPIVMLIGAPNSLLTWLGLPLALVASCLFCLIGRASASAMYRTGAYVCLITGIGAYQWLWSSINASA